MRILVMSDIHANYTALEAVLKDAGPVDETWCLGDLVGYGPDPNVVLEMIRDIPSLTCILGNHDVAVIAGWRNFQGASVFQQQVQAVKSEENCTFHTQGSSGAGQNERGVGPVQRTFGSDDGQFTVVAHLISPHVDEMMQRFRFSWLAKLRI